MASTPGPLLCWTSCRSLEFLDLPWSMSSSFLLFTKLHLPQRNKSIGDTYSVCAQPPLPSTLERVLGRILIDVIVHLFSIKEASKSWKSMLKTIPDRKDNTTHTQTHRVFYGRVLGQEMGYVIMMCQTWVRGYLSELSVVPNIFDSLQGHSHT